MGVLVQHYKPIHEPNPSEMFYSQWMATQKAKLQAEIQELLVKLESGTGIPMWMIVDIVIKVINGYSVQLKNDIALPLEHYQNISKYHSILRDKLNKLKSGEFTEKDAEEFAKAIKDLDEALEALRQEYEPTDPSIPEDKQWPKGVKEVYDRLRKNLDMILDEKHNNNGDNKTVAEMIQNGDWDRFMVALKSWKDQSDIGKGPFVDWESGKNGADGLVTVRLIVDTEMGTYNDKLSQMTNLIVSLQSMAKENNKYAANLIGTIVSNYRKS